ncbi:hypothetical protein HDV63DRAFT_383008 [Trichoderma sp. SZMC 28014]
MLFEDKLLKDLEHDLPPSKDQLSEKNLRIHNGEGMDLAANSSSALKRSSSSRSRETPTERSQRSYASTAAVYRQKCLRAFKIYTHVEPPDYIQAAIDRVVTVQVSEERRSELRVIAQGFRDRCLEHVRSQAGEDDFLKPFNYVLEALGLKNLCIHQKADWRLELKPAVPPKPNYSSSFMFGVQQSAGQLDSHEPSMMPPPPLPRSLVKTPRPDISMGIHYEALISALKDLSKVNAEEFLEWLQNEMVQHEPDGSLDPMLIFVPALRALELTFPFAVVEGKAYSTGQQIFEAENQAAVAGACGLKIQLDLDNLVHAGATGSDALPTPSDTEPPLFFTICTQGPIHELWAHWTFVEYDTRKFGSKLLDSCNALLLEQGEDFVVRLNNVCLWGLGPFMKSVAERLATVAKKANV